MPPLGKLPARNPSLQRSVSSGLMQAVEMPTGQEIWVEDEKDVWVLTSLVRQDNTILGVRRNGTGELLNIDLVSLLTKKPSYPLVHTYGVL